MAVRPATREDADALELLASRDPTTARTFSDYDKARMAQLMEGGDAAPGVFARVGTDALTGDVDALCWVDVNPHELEIVVVWLLPLERMAQPKLLGPFKAAMLAAEAAWPASRGWLVYAIFPANPADPLQARMIAATWKLVFGAKVFSSGDVRGSDTFEARNLTHLRAIAGRLVSPEDALIWLPTAGQAYDIVRVWP